MGIVDPLTSACDLGACFIPRAAGSIMWERTFTIASHMFLLSVRKNQKETKTDIFPTTSYFDTLLIFVLNTHYCVYLYLKSHTL